MAPVLNADPQLEVAARGHSRGGASVPAAHQTSPASGAVESLNDDAAEGDGGGAGVVGGLVTEIGVEISEIEFIL